MHRILLREVIIDVPTGQLPAVQAFWADALDGQPRRLEDYPEFTALDDAASLSFVGLQDIGTDAARFHLDLETDDIPAEVARLTRLGATVVSEQEGCVVLRDPAGLLFCVVEPETPAFTERSRSVE